MDRGVSKRCIPTPRERRVKVKEQPLTVEEPENINLHQSRPEKTTRIDLQS